MLMEYNQEEIGKMIKKEREKRSWSQSKMGEKINVSGKQISIYENGGLPPLDNLLRICKVFDVELGYLLGEESYQKGTKLETQIYNLTGLTNKSMEVLEYLTSPKSRFYFGHESESIRRILNSFICAEGFPNLIDAFFSIYSCGLSSINLEEKYIADFSDSIRNQVGEMLTSSIDYEYDSSVEALPDEVAQAYMMVNSIIDEQRKQEFNAKVGRYEVNEALISILNQMFDERSKLIVSQ